VSGSIFTSTFGGGFQYSVSTGIVNIGPNYAYAINASGQISLGYSPARYSSGTVTPLPCVSPPSPYQSSPPAGYAGLGIDSSGDIVGEVFAPPNSSQPFFSDGTTTVVLGSLGGNRAGATAINDLGDIVGYSQTASTPSGDIWNPGHAFIYKSTDGILDLNSVLPRFSPWELRSAAGINGAGQVVGFGQFIDPTTLVPAIRAFRYTDGNVLNLGTFPNGGISQAFGVNSAGEVVGEAYLDASGAGNFEAAVYIDGFGMLNLNDMIPAADAQNWTLRVATAINDTGLIVGYGYNSQFPGQTRSFLLTPQPGPTVLPSIQASSHPIVSNPAILYSDSFAPGGTWVDPSAQLVGDFDGNGYGDIANIFADQTGTINIDVYLNNVQDVPNGHTALSLQRWTTHVGGYVTGMQWRVGDFNGDGVSDIASIYNSGGYNAIDVYLSNGTQPGGFSLSHWATAPNAGGWVDLSDWLPGDFDGDGVDDLAHVFSNKGIDGPGDIDIDVYRSNRSGFAATRWNTGQGLWLDVSVHDPRSTYAWWFSSIEPLDGLCSSCERDAQWVAGDFNGDGFGDLGLVFNDGNGWINIDTHLSNGTEFVLQRAATRQGGWVEASYWTTADMDGDGRTDFVNYFADPTDAGDNWRPGQGRGYSDIDVHLSKINGFSIPNANGLSFSRWASGLLNNFWTPDVDYSVFPDHPGWLNGYVWAGLFDNSGYASVLVVNDTTEQNLCGISANGNITYVWTNPCDSNGKGVLQFNYYHREAEINPNRSCTVGVCDPYNPGSDECGTFTDGCYTCLNYCDDNNPGYDGCGNKCSTQPPIVGSACSLGGCEFY
jgi:probable HAF family extracellular repeat protein